VRSDAEDGSEAPSGRSRAPPSESNHTCLPACDIIVMRVRALYTPFTAKCSWPVRPAAGRMKRHVRRRRTVCSSARRFPLTLRAASDYASPCAFRACLLAVECFIHARACDVTHYTTCSRSEAFSSLPESSRWMRDWLSYLYSRLAGTPFSYRRDVCRFSSEKMFLRSHISF